MDSVAESPEDRVGKGDTDFERLVSRFNELAEIDSKSPISIDDPGWSEWYVACGTWVAKKARGG